MKIKYHDESYRLSRYYLNGKPYYGAAGVLAASGISQKVNIQFMDYRDGKLAIDGTLSGIYDIEEGHFYVETENGIIEVEKRERYSHTKLFGISFYKRISFRVVIPVENVIHIQAVFPVNLKTVTGHSEKIIWQHINSQRL